MHYVNIIVFLPLFVVVVPSLLSGSPLRLFYDSVPSTFFSACVPLLL